MKHQATSLIVNIWFEPESEHGPEGEWRGRVTNVVTEQVTYFRALDNLSEAVAGILPESPPNGVSRKTNLIPISRDRKRASNE